MIERKHLRLICSAVLKPYKEKGTFWGLFFFFLDKKANTYMYACNSLHLGFY